jgi:pimeloyl-ACP methyl ester carboxylesterase
MRFTSETTSNGVSERLFTVDEVPGVLWTPADAAGSALVLLCHGGGQHKRAQGLVARAHRYVTACGFAVAATDAPGHGDRRMAHKDERFAADIRERIAAGEPIGPYVIGYNTDVSARAVPEWQATLNALQKIDWIGAGGPVGFWGVSLGTAIGVPFAAADPRITAAVFGLAAHEALAGRRPGSPSRSSSCCSGTMSSCRANRALPYSTPSPPARRRCTPIPAATSPCLRSS